MKTNIVIIGGGIIGVSVAYHLSLLGVSDILLLDKGDLDENDGSTSHAPGGLQTLMASDFFTRLGSKSRELYDKLPLAIEGQEQFFRTGAVGVAQGSERYEALLRQHEMGLTMGIESHLLTPKEVIEKQPLLDAGQITGGLYIPGAGIVKTSLIATSMRRLAEQTGNLTCFAHTQVDEILTQNGRVRGVQTNHPSYPLIECEQVVLCSNIWAPVLCDKLGVNMPLYPGQHQYIFTEPVDALKEISDVEVALPISGIGDLSIYFRQHFDRIGIGSYHHKAMLVNPHKLGKTAKMPFTPDDFTTAWSLMQGLMPPLRTSKVSHGFNGMFSFTVDGFPIVGESPIKGLWTSVGAWLSFAGELGKVLAQWMTAGDPGMDMRRADINRFHPFQMNRDYLRSQSSYYYEIGHEIIHPSQVASAVRDLRHSPYHERMKALGAVFVPVAGTETTAWYESNRQLAEKYAAQIPLRTGWAAKFWSPIEGGEHLAAREHVGLIDWSAGIGPIEVSGPGALAYLNALCTNEIDKPVGQIVYTLWLTPQGGIKRDVTIARLAEDRFWVLTGRSNMPAELAWMQRFAPKDGSVSIVNLSDGMVSFGLWGPNARQVLAEVATDDVSNAAFPFYTVQPLGIGMVPATALRLSYVGELGWEIYAPAGYGMRLWDTLMEAGQAHHLVPIGSRALLSMRLEKGYRLYGADVTTETNPYEVGLHRLLRFKKGDFVGREAALKAKNRPQTRKLVTLTFDDPATIMYGFEPVMLDGRVIGRITSGGYGYSIGKFIANALLDIEHCEVGTTVDVQYTGNYYQGVVAPTTLLDPEMKRMKQ